MEASDVLALIHDLANERHAIYVRASHGKMDTHDLARVREIDRELEGLWDALRRIRAKRRKEVERAYKARRFAQHSGAAHRIRHPDFVH